MNRVLAWASRRGVGLPICCLVFRHRCRPSKTAILEWLSRDEICWFAPVGLSRGAVCPCLCFSSILSRARTKFACNQNCCMAVVCFADALVMCVCVCVCARSCLCRICVRACVASCLHRISSRSFFRLDAISRWFGPSIMIQPWDVGASESQVRPRPQLLVSCVEAGTSFPLESCCSGRCEVVYRLCSLDARPGCYWASLWLALARDRHLLAVARGQARPVLGQEGDDARLFEGCLGPSASSRSCSSVAPGPGSISCWARAFSVGGS